MKSFNIGTLTILPLTLALSSTAIADQVFNDDLIIQGSACVGIDCSNGESFGFDTIRLKENNLRIRFDDTSVSASFPKNDWQITINDSENGGAEKFAIDDITNSKTPFTVEGNTPNNTLYVDSAGRIGVKTNQPAVDVHIKEGNSPALRLEQDGSDGFTSQTWDIAGNETNFFIRDVTNSSKLPFKIKPGAPTNALYIDSDGDIGLSTSTPGSALHVVSGASTSGVLIEESDSNAASEALVHVRSTSPRAILENANNTAASDKNYIYLKNLGDTQMVFENNASGVDWKIGNNADKFTIVTPTSGDGLSGVGTEFSLDVNGNLTTTGTVSGSSSRALKENILNIDSSVILNKLANLGVYSWNYIKEGDSVTHVGPMAEDFHNAFGLNGDTTDKISYTDITGIAIAAIQELKKQSEQKDKRIDELEEKLLRIQEQLAQ